jgi:hypothetical protein
MVENSQDKEEQDADIANIWFQDDPSLFGLAVALYSL